MSPLRKAVDEAARARAIELAAPIAEVTGVTVETMLGRDRSPQATYARRHLMAALWRTGMSIAEVAAVLDRDHSTVITGLRELVPQEAYRTEVLSRYAPSRLPSYRGRVST